MTDTDVKEIVKQTVKAVREYDEKQRLKKAKERYDWRLRNTKLLLKHYKYFKDHTEDSIYNTSQINALYMIDECRERSSTVFIESIKASTQKTFIILKHIDQMIELYEYIAEKKGEIEQRKLRVLKYYYFECMRSQDIGIKENIDERTCRRDLNDAIDILSALIFGVESIEEMAKN